MAGPSMMAPDEGSGTATAVAPTPSAIQQSTDLYAQLQAQREARQAAQLPSAGTEAQRAAAAQSAVMTDVQRLQGSAWVKPAIAVGAMAALWFFFLRKR